MGGDFGLDHSYQSETDGCPGTRFIVDLKQPAIGSRYFNEIDSPSTSESDDTTLETSTMSSFVDDALPELPECLSVLFTDDDPVLRKLFSRRMRTVAPKWKIREAANGETALRLVETEHFDLIFMDMYMASVEKQLLGTETVKALRQQGVDCRICGLSANDKGMF